MDERDDDVDDQRDHEGCQKKGPLPYLPGGREGADHRQEQGEDGVDSCQHQDGQAVPAGAGKPTIYRRWPDRTRLLLAEAAASYALTRLMMGRLPADPWEVAGVARILVHGVQGPVAAR